MGESNFVSLRVADYLIRTRKHNYSCSNGEITGQVHTNDLPDDNVYYIRRCNVCGDPFADGTAVHEPIEGILSYVAKSETTMEDLCHLRVDGLNNDRADVINLQPNHFLRSYNPHKLVIKRSATKRETTKFPRLLEFFSDRNQITEGGSMIEAVYDYYYGKLRPIPPIIGNLITRKNLIPGVDGRKFYKGFIKTKESGNKIGLKTKISFKIEDIDKTIRRWRGKEVLDFYAYVKEKGDKK